MFNSNQMFIFCSKYILLLGERKSIQGYGADISYGSWLEQITKSCTSFLKNWGVYDLRPQQLKKTKIKGLKVIGGETLPGHVTQRPAAAQRPQVLSLPFRHHRFNSLRYFRLQWMLYWNQAVVLTLSVAVFYTLQNEVTKGGGKKIHVFFTAYSAFHS